MTTPEVCPVCGAEVPRGAYACSACGADERSGWNEEETRYDGLDLPEDCFNDFAEKEELTASSKNRGGAKIVIAIVTILTLLAFCLSFVL